MITPPLGQDPLHGPAEDPTVHWDEILDRLELALETGVEFDPPVDVPVMPERLLTRARALLERQRVATAELEAERERVAAELDDQRRRAAPTPVAPSGAALSL